MEYRSGARICRESRPRRFAKEGPGSSLTQPKRNDAVVSTNQTRSVVQGNTKKPLKAPKTGAGDFSEQARRLCAITRVSIHGLRSLIRDTGVSARKFRGAALGMWGRGVG